MAKDPRDARDIPPEKHVFTPPSPVGAMGASRSRAGLGVAAQVVTVSSCAAKGALGTRGNVYVTPARVLLLEEEKEVEEEAEEVAESESPLASAPLAVGKPPKSPVTSNRERQASVPLPLPLLLPLPQGRPLRALL